MTDVRDLDGKEMRAITQLLRLLRLNFDVSLLRYGSWRVTGHVRGFVTLEP